MSPSVKWLVVAAAIAVALGIGYRLGRAGDDASAPPAHEGSDRREILYWYDPMVPDQRFDRPGKSPFMDMMLVPRYADEATTAGVRIDPVLRQSLGIRTSTVEAGSLPVSIRAPGTLTWDLRGEHRIGARTEAIVERLHVRAPFEPVQAGQPLATLLAPELSSALAEYRALAAGGSAGARDLREAARTRLRLLGLSEGDLRGGAGTPRVVVRAPADGVLSAIDVREGDSLMPGQPMFRLNAEARLWLELALPQSESGLVRAGDAVEVAVDAHPGEVFVGEVEALLPEVDPRTRTRTARVVLSNPDHRLAAGMFAEAVLRPAAGPSRPLLPAEALIQDGRQARVIVAGDESFVPMAVRVGRRAGGLVEVLDGLQGGERVVVSGQFLIDSEASLGGALRRLQPDAEPASAEHAHEAHAPGERAAGGQSSEPHAHHDHDTPVLHEADARIEAIEGLRLVLDHGPFPTLDMPAMTMGFRLADAGIAAGFVAGDRVRVAVRSEGRDLVVQRMARLGAQP